MEKHPDDWLGIRSSDGALDVGQEVCLLELSLWIPLDKDDFLLSYLSHVVWKCFQNANLRALCFFMQ